VSACAACTHVAAYGIKGKKSNTMQAHLRYMKTLHAEQVAGWLAV
jgi:hypothetical protein